MSDNVGGPTVSSTRLLADLEKLRRKAQRLARAERKHVGNDITHFEGVCKGQWMAYDWAACRLRDIIKANAEVRHGEAQPRS